MSTLSLLTLTPEPDYGHLRYYVRRVAALLDFDRLHQVRMAAAVVAVGSGLPAGPAPPAVTLKLVNTRSPSFLIDFKLEDESPASEQPPAPVRERVERFFDRFSHTRPHPSILLLSLETLLPGSSAPLSAAAVARLRRAIETLPPPPPAVSWQQNEDLLYTLELLQGREEELHRLNLELEDTNRGVLALYSEMDERAIHFHFLADAGRILATSLDYDKTLTELARLVVPNLADWCAVDLVKEGEGLARIAVAHRNAVQEALVRRLQHHRAKAGRLPWNLAAVLAGGQAQLFAQLSPGLEEVEATATYRSLLKELETRSIMVVPLRAHRRVLGILTLAAGPSGRQFTVDDLVLAEELASLAALAVDNTRLYQEANRLNEELEQRVAARTAALEQTNVALELEIQDRRRAEEQLRMRTEQLEAMGRMGQSVAATLDLHTVLARVLAELSELLPGEGSLIWLLEEERLHLEAARGPAAGLVRRDLDVESLLERSLQQGETVLVADLATVLNGGHLPVRSLLAAPLLWQGSALGVLGVVHTQPRSFDDSDRSLLEAATSWTAIALQNARLYGQVRDSREQLRKLSRQLVAAQEEERKRLAQELHDEAGQALTALKLNLSLLEGQVPGKLPALQEGLQDGIDLADQTMEQLRLVSHALRPPSLDKLGLNATLEGLCRDYASRTGLVISYQGAEAVELPDAYQISLYRFAQEALTNIGKHAAAQKVEVLLAHADGVVSLSVRDDGRGFDLEQVLHGGESSGIGLLGMRERVELLGGDLRIHTRPGAGTHLQAFVPL